MQRSRLASYMLVAIQFACLIAIALTGPILARDPRLIDLLVKLHYEERLLLNHFAGYREYMAGSKRLVPYLY